MSSSPSSGPSSFLRYVARALPRSHRKRSSLSILRSEMLEASLQLRNLFPLSLAWVFVGWHILVFSMIFCSWAALALAFEMTASCLTLSAASSSRTFFALLNKYVVKLISNFLQLKISGHSAVFLWSCLNFIISSSMYLRTQKSQVDPVWSVSLHLAFDIWRLGLIKVSSWTASHLFSKWSSAHVSKYLTSSPLMVCNVHCWYDLLPKIGPEYQLRLSHLNKSSAPWLMITLVLGLFIAFEIMMDSLKTQLN